MERPTEVPSQQPETRDQACEWATSKADPPAPVKPSDDKNLMRNPEPELPSQVTLEFLIHSHCEGLMMMIVTLNH